MILVYRVPNVPAKNRGTRLLPNAAVSLERLRPVGALPLPAMLWGLSRPGRLPHAHLVSDRSAEGRSDADSRFTLLGQCRNNQCVSPTPIGPGGACTIDQECFANAFCVSGTCNDVGFSCIASDGSSTGATDTTTCSAGEFANPSYVSETDSIALLFSIRVLSSRLMCILSPRRSRRAVSPEFPMHRRRIMERISSRLRGSSWNASDVRWSYRFLL